ncbi:hypothetical protein [Catenuloplanes japonicus]|uniref:hypothetical protein n=1 Tax=Catenuloplanes japonicus TaxID=33876 RepID=UPI0005246A3B|nr:hypothetical protein [Catenuloplanes japonicus]
MQCARCGTRFGRLTPIGAPRQAAAIGAGTSVLDGVLVAPQSRPGAVVPSRPGAVVPPSRQNGPVDRLPVPQPLLVAGPPPVPEEDVAPGLFAGVWHVAVVLLVALAGLTALISAIMLQLPASAPTTYISHWFSTAVTVLGLALGGTADGGPPAGNLTLQMTPVLLTAAIAGPLAGLAMRDERRRRSPGLGVLLTRALITAGTAAGLMAAAGALGFTQYSTAGTAFALVLAVALVARLAATPSAAPGQLRAMTRPVTDALALTARFGVTLLIGAGLTGLVLVAASGGSLPAVVAGLIALPALVLALLGVPVTSTVVDGVSLVAHPSWWTLLLLVPAGSVLVAAVRHALSRPVGAPRRPLMTVLTSTAVVMLVALAGQVTVSLMASEVQAGPSLTGAAVAGLGWGVLLALASYAARDLALLSRRVLAPVEPSWRALLYGTARARASVVVAVAVALVAPAAGVGGVVFANQSVFGPVRVAHDYLAAISDGDAAAALALRGDVAAGPLLTAAVLRAPGVERPADVNVVTSTVDGRTATVTASFTLGGEPQVMTLALAAEARRYGMFDDWRVVSDLGTVASSSALPVTVAGVALDPARPVAALPGRYPMALADPTGRFSAERTSVLILGEMTEAAPGAQMSAETQERVKRALDTWLTACADRTDMFRFDCPFDLRAAHVFFASSARYTLQRTPQTALRPSADGGIEVVTTTPGTVDYRAIMPEGPEETGTLEYSVDGIATIGDDGTVTITLP